MITIMICQLVDLYFVAGLGDAAVAGVAAAGNAGFLVNALMQVLGVGTVALIAHAVGRTDRADAIISSNTAGISCPIKGIGATARQDTGERCWSKPNWATNWGSLHCGGNRAGRQYAAACACPI